MFTVCLCSTSGHDTSGSRERGGSVCFGNRKRISIRPRAAVLFFVPHSTVIVISRAGDRRNDIKQGREGECWVFFLLALLFLLLAVLTRRAGTGKRSRLIVN